jgi:hypothetical protein
MERMVIKRNIIDVFIIEESFLRLVLLSNSRNTNFYRKFDYQCPSGWGCRGQQPLKSQFGGQFIVGVQGAAAP